MTVLKYEILHTEKFKTTIEALKQKIQAQAQRLPQWKFLKNLKSIA